MSERGQQIEAWLAEARERHVAAAEKLDEMQQKGGAIVEKAVAESRAIVEKAKAERRELLAGTKAAEGDARAEVRKLEKIRLLERGESLQGHRPKPNQSNGQVPVEVLDRIEEVAKRQSADAKDHGFTIGSVHNELKAEMSREQIAAGVEQGNRDWADQSARWRKAGKRRGGLLYKPWEED